VESVSRNKARFAFPIYGTPSNFPPFAFLPGGKADIDLRDTAARDISHEEDASPLFSHFHLRLDIPRGYEGTVEFFRGVRAFESVYFFGLPFFYNSFFHSLFPYFSFDFDSFYDRPASKIRSSEKREQNSSAPLSVLFPQLSDYCRTPFLWYFSPFRPLA